MLAPLLTRAANVPAAGASFGLEDEGRGRGSSPGGVGRCPAVNQSMEKTRGGALKNNFALQALKQDARLRRRTFFFFYFRQLECAKLLL